MTKALFGKTLLVISSQSTDLAVWRSEHIYPDMKDE